MSGGSVQEPETEADINWDDVKQEMVHYLQRLLQIDTSSSRHRETVAAHYLRTVLTANGLPATVREPISGKGSLICRLPGKVPNQALLLLSHLDVAPAGNVSAWRHLPFSGDRDSGEVWGRGAIDCKGLAVVWLMLVLLIRRKRIPLQRGLVFAATADEEAGGRWGVDWLLKSTDDFRECRYALNEGGGFSFHRKRGDVYTCQYAEKGHLVLDCQMKAEGSGNLCFNFPSRQLGPQNPDLMQPMLQALWRIHHLPRALESLFSCRGKLALLKRFSNLPLDYEALLNNIFEAESLPPAEDGSCVLRLHIRMLPGESGQEWQEKIFQLRLIDPQYLTDTRIVSCSEPSNSPLDTPLYRGIVSAMRGRGEQTIELLPFITPGSTDSGLLRKKGISSYGFFPTPPETDIRLIHRANERISEDALLFALRRLHKIVTRFVTGGDFA
ncbi:M20/M25/M40 family metallo-hydrolase [Desulfosporosinus sp. PR]|uniref:M20/M25/M40 family metallo-hydrolase n=1 Tax=Candidatus Desulfosporosinus nitrosoreducens TaxID=3401928 RepID=UPI0027F58569|nr:M20/M25/M40 family metallo-hydrolase [Desulfosporosinus sp. PR]MDQ7094461.1 M20/M25/M40 family metallo-hydrolase [Desulfosporosinus sp. PR]